MILAFLDLHPGCKDGLLMCRWWASSQAKSFFLIRPLARMLLSFPVGNGTLERHFGRLAKLFQNPKSSLIRGNHILPHGQEFDLFAFRVGLFMVSAGRLRCWPSQSSHFFGRSGFFRTFLFVLSLGHFRSMDPRCGCQGTQTRSSRLRKILTNASV